MPIGSLTSQLFANLYLGPLDHFIKEQLRQRYYIRYMDDFVILGQEDKSYEAKPRKIGKRELWKVLDEVRAYLVGHLKLELNPKRVAVTPIEQGVDFLGYVIFPGGYKRIRRRNVVNFRRRLKRLAMGYSEETIPYDQARASMANWLGLAKHANAFRLSRAIFLEQDVCHIGKRLLIKVGQS